MSVKYSLVSIKDGKRRVKYIVLTKDIKGYSPQNAEDVPEREFMVKWQESFHGDDVVHDGYYPGEILLAGATKQEILAKAKEKKIKLPPNVLADANGDKDEPVSKSMGKPLRKQRTRPKHEEPEVQVKKRRMLDVLKEVQDSSSEGKPPNPTVQSEQASQGDTSLDKKTTVVKQLFNDRDGNDKSPDVDDSRSVEKLKERSSISPEPQPSKSDLQATNRKSPMQAGLPSDEMPKELTKSAIKLKKPSKSDSANVDLLLSDTDSESRGDDSDADPDDATVLLAALKKEHGFCETQIDELEKFKKKAINDLKVYKIEMEKKRRKITELKEQLNDLKVENMSLKEKLQQKPKDVTPCKVGMKSPVLSALSFVASPLSSSTPAVPSRSKKEQVSAKKKLFGEDELSESELDSTVPVSPSTPKMTTSKADVESSPMKETKKIKIGSNDGNDSDLDAIAERVKCDLTGGKPLKERGDKVYIGKGVTMNSKLWKQSTRKRRKDSMFFKDCAAGVWGVDELSKRTAQRKMKGKNPCTPKKVDVINAMLMGKIMSRGVGKEDARKQVESQANRWLTEKCYDCGRPPQDEKKLL